MAADAGAKVLLAVKPLADPNDAQPVHADRICADVAIDGTPVPVVLKSSPDANPASDVLFIFATPGLGYVPERSPPAAPVGDPPPPPDGGVYCAAQVAANAMQSISCLMVPLSILSHMEQKTSIPEVDAGGYPLPTKPRISVVVDDGVNVVE